MFINLEIDSLLNYNLKLDPKMWFEVGNGLLVDFTTKKIKNDEENIIFSWKK